MGKSMTHAGQKGTLKTYRRSALTSLFTLALWRFRQSWWLLFLTGIALLAALTVACIAPLFTNIATDAGLQNVFTGSPTHSIMALTTDSQTFSSSVVQQTRQSFERTLRANFGTYLDASIGQVMTIDKMVITRPQSLSTVNPLDLYATSLTRLKPALSLLAGHWASEDMNNGVIEIMLTSDTAQALHLTIGTTMTLQGGFITDASPAPVDPQNVLHVRLAGIFASPKEANPALFGETFQPDLSYIGPTYTLLMADSAFLQACDQIAAHEHSQTISVSSSINPSTHPFRLTWYYHLHTSQLSFANVSDLTNRLANTEYRVGNLSDEAQFFNPAPAGADVFSLLQQYAGRVAIVDRPVMLLACLIIALLLFFAGLLSNLLLERQMAMQALLGSRGASAPQLFWSLALQAFWLCILAALLGPLLGALAVFALAHQLLSAQEQSVLALTFGEHSLMLALAAPYVLGTLVAGLLAVCLPLRRASGRDMLDLRRETTRTTWQPFWRRYYLDGWMALLALSAFGVSLYLANAAHVLDTGTQELLLAPLVLLAPVFLLFGCLLLFLRIFPAALRFAAGHMQRIQGALAVLSLIQMARASRQALRVILMLALAGAFALFALSFVASQNQHTLDIADYESGADFTGNLSANIASEDQSTVASQYSRIPGVEAVSLGYIDQGEATGLNDSNVQLQLRAVDARSFASVAIWNQQDSSQSLSTLMGLLQKPGASTFGVLVIPAVVDETTLTSLHLRVGGVFEAQLTLLGGAILSFQVVAVAQHIPSINSVAGSNDPLSMGGILVDYQALVLGYHAFQQQVAGELSVPSTQLQPDYIWLRTSDSPALLTAVRAALQSSSLALANLNDRREITSELQQDPLTLSVLLMVSISASAALGLALLSTILASWLHLRQRLKSFVVLRALGTTRMQILGMLCWEQGIIAFMALLLSIAAGAALIWLAVPALLFTSLPEHGSLSEVSINTFYLLQRILPSRVVLSPDLLLVFLVLLLASGGALLLMARTVLWSEASSELRLSED